MPVLRYGLLRHDPQPLPHFPLTSIANGDLQWKTGPTLANRGLGLVVGIHLQGLAEASICLAQAFINRTFLWIGEALHV